MRVSEAVEWIIELFELTGYAVIERVGDAPGTVDRFARAREGRDRPLVLWSIWPESPADLDAALAGLEAARQRTGADRAVGLVLAFMAEVAAGAVSVMGLREYVFDILGLTSKLRKIAELTSHPLSRLGLAEGREVDPVSYTTEWVESGSSDCLTLHGYGASDISREVARRQASRYLLDASSAVTPLVQYPQLEPAVWTHLAPQKWILPVWGSRPTTRPPIRPALFHSLLRTPDGPVCELTAAKPLDVREWLAQNLSPHTYALWQDAIAEEPALWWFFKTANLSICHEMEAVARIHDTSMSWMVTFIYRSIEGVKRDTLQRLSKAFFEAFALGKSSVLEGLNPAERELTDNRLLRDYSIALYVASRFHEGDRHLVTRYRFPERYVLFFLAHLAPEAVAHATADRTDELRRQIADEVEREVQLTLSHHLRGSVGAARAHFKRIKRALTREQHATLGREIGRLHEELDYLERLAERTRLYHEVPETETTDLDLIAHAERVVAELKRRYPAIAWDVDLPPTLYARAQPDGVYDILHNIVENAAHATLRGDAPRITLRAIAHAETISIEVSNTGPGIPPADRERIFDPRVTTKKGGDQPLGTGMGLPIARRYAATVGGRVDLDPDSPETCFVIRFVAARTQGRP